MIRKITIVRLFFKVYKINGFCVRRSSALFPSYFGWGVDVGIFRSRSALDYDSSRTGIGKADRRGHDSTSDVRPPYPSMLREGMHFSYLTNFILEQTKIKLNVIESTP
jgi:hypothetical protein